MKLSALWNSIKLGMLQLVSRPIFIFSMILVPIGASWILIDMMKSGLPDRVPAAVVDLDHTEMSRTVTRTLNSLQTVDVKMKLNSYTEANDAMKRGEIFGFFIIPENFSQDVLAAKQPQISYYNNMAFYVPGSLVYKGFKMGSAMTSGGIAKSVLMSTGEPGYKIVSTLLPLQSDIHPLGNPWMNYNYYLGNSFIPCILVLMIMLVTVFSICSEIKYATSVRWLNVADGSIILAVIGKLLPQTIIFCSVGVFLQSLMFGYYHFPLNGEVWHIIMAMIFLVVASQAFALFIVSILPNMRIALSVCSLVGILSFSVGGFSFPIDSMYGYIGIFSYIIPIRYYFLIYIQEALNGLPIYYARFYYAALLIFPLLPFAFLWRLKKACMNPVYIP